MKKSYWDLTNRPHTELKLRILEEYVYAWSTVLFGYGTRNSIEAYKKIYYIDCFSGRGRYHKGGKRDSILGSPLIALECALTMQSKYEGVKLKCIFVEENKTYHRELSDFCKLYGGKIDFKILPRGDFNEYCEQILDEVNSSPSFFFIDPGGIKEIKKETIEKISAKKGPNDTLLNYIKGGVERITGLIKKKSVFSNEKEALKRIKTIKRLTDFYGMNIYKNLGSTERERLKGWVDSMLRSGSLNEVAVFDMTDPKRKGAIYYLLFASKKPVAKKIIKDIFKKAKRADYTGQMRMPFELDFDI